MLGQKQKNETPKPRTNPPKTTLPFEWYNLIQLFCFCGCIYGRSDSKFWLSEICFPFLSKTFGCYVDADLQNRVYICMAFFVWK